MGYLLLPMARLVGYLLLPMARSVAYLLLPMARSVAASGLALWVVLVLLPVALSARDRCCHRSSRTARLPGLGARKVRGNRRIGNTSRLALHDRCLVRAVAFSSAGDLAPWPLARLGPSLLAVASSASALLVADVLERSLLAVAAATSWQVSLAAPEVRILAA